MKKIYFVIQFLCIIMMHFLSSQSSAIMIGMGTEELTNESALIVRGEVAEVETRWSADEKTIITRASVIITDNIKGQTSSKIITVEYEGGEIGDIGLRVSDISPLEMGEEVILFLNPAKSIVEGDVYSIVGKAQGKYTVDSEGIARKSGFSVISGEDMVDNNIPVEKLIEKIKGVK